MKRRGAFAAAALITAAHVVAGCGQAEVPLSPAAANPTAATATIAIIATPAPSASAATSAATSPGLPSGGPGADVVMDPSLLGLLPALIGTAQVGIEPDSFAEAVRDASFVANVDSAAFVVVTDGEDLASGVVAHLRPDVYSDVFYRDWRDSYDEGACGQAGGVAAHAEVTLGGRPAFITTCAGGLRVYHAYVPEREVIVSVFSLGERRFGEQLLAGIRP